MSAHAPARRSVGSSRARASSRSRTNRSAGADHALPHQLHAHVGEPGGARPSARSRRRTAARVRAEPPDAELRERGEALARARAGSGSVGMSDIVSTPPGRSTRIRLGEERAPRREVERRLHADQRRRTSRCANGIRQASPFTGRARRPREAAAPGAQLRQRDVEGGQDCGRGDLARSAGSCAARPLPTSSTSPPVRQRRPRSPSTSRRTATGASAGSLPSPSHSPRFSHPASSARKKSVADAVVDRRGRVPPVAEHRGGVAQVLPGPGGAPTPSGRSVHAAARQASRSLTRAPSAAPRPRYRRAATGTSTPCEPTSSASDSAICAAASAAPEHDPHRHRQRRGERQDRGHDRQRASRGPAARRSR